MPSVLSIVIPAYNEERFIGTLLERVRALDLTPLSIATEVIVVDDRSTDRTAEIAAGFPGVKLVRLPARGGKGRAVAAGVRAATGEYLIIQDADLEYDPRDYLPMLQALVNADVVYGSRYLEAGRRPRQGLLAYLGGRSFTLFAYALTGAWITDTATALKLFRRELVAGLSLTTAGFEIDQEITAKLVARGARLAEVPVRYVPRTRREGKKVRARDWLTGVITLVRFRNG